MDTLNLDVDPNGWTFIETMDYRAKVGCNPHYAIVRIGEALASDDSADASNIPPEYLLGMAWITERRTEPSLTYEQTAERVDYRALIDAVVRWAIDHTPDPPTAPNRAARRANPSTRKGTTSPRKRPSSTSAAAIADGPDATS